MHLSAADWRTGRWGGTLRLLGRSGSAAAADLRGPVEEALGSTMAAGYVYILLNPCMPCLVKIRHSTRLPEDRARELPRETGVPAPFSVAYEEGFEIYFREVEQEVHRQLDRFRANKD